MFTNEVTLLGAHLISLAIPVSCVVHWCLYRMFTYLEAS